MSRILMQIYRVPINLTKSEIRSQFLPTPSDYLIGVSEEDIYKKDNDLVIAVSADNFSNVDSSNIIPGEYVVYQDTKEKYILVNNQKFYIPKISNKSEELTKIFEFYVNPTRVTPTYRKIFNEVRTRGGWEIQHWGNALTEIHVECVTGGMLYKDFVKTNENALLKSDSITNSLAWKKVQNLRRIYEEDHNQRNITPKSLLGITYYDSFYVGFFTEFVGPIADAEKPYLMSFTFTFKVQESIYLKILEGI